MKAAAKTIITMSILGIINASYLTYLFIQETFLGVKTPSICDISNSLSCTNVITSEYGKLFGLPICTIALFIYPVLLILGILALKKEQPKDIFFALGILSALGTMMNLIYVYNEFAFIGAFCLLCILCGIFIITNLLMSIVGYRKSNECKTKN